MAGSPCTLLGSFRHRPCVCVCVRPNLVYYSIPNPRLPMEFNVAWVILNKSDLSIPPTIGTRSLSSKALLFFRSHGVREAATIMGQKPVGRWKIIVVKITSSFWDRFATTKVGILIGESRLVFGPIPGFTSVLHLHFSRQNVAAAVGLKWSRRQLGYAYI